MKHVFIVNPAAGKFDRTESYQNMVREAFAPRGVEYEILVSQAPGECRRLAHEIAASGEQARIYACGGDGTLNEVVNGVAGFENVAITHFPGGSGNDWIKVFSNPAAFAYIDRLLDADEARFDLIRCNDTYSLNILSLGFDARVGTDIARFKRMPLVSGKGAYVMSIFSNLVHGLSAKYEIAFDDGETIAGEKTLVCVCNGRWYGGGFNPVPEAEPDDGLLDVLVVEKVNLLQVASVIGSYQKGLYANYPELIRYKRCRSLRIACDEESVVNVDGEALYTREAEIAVVPQAIRFFYPKGLTYRVKN